jgi:hypothetical protein
MSFPTGSITTKHELSLWHVEGLPVPLDLISFREQIMKDGSVVVVIHWRPKKEHKEKGEL